MRRWVGSLVVGALAFAAHSPGAAGQSVPELSALTWRQVSAGSVHTCAVATTGRLYCWGHNRSGATGSGSGAIIERAPVEVGGAPQDWRSVSAGGYADNAHTCAVTTSGRLFCWGSDQHGEVGDDAALVDQPVPVEVAGGSTRWASVSVGDAHTCALRTSGRLYCWGSDWSSQLGDGATTTSRPTPVEVGDRTADWIAVSAGYAHTCAVKRSHRLFCWGADDESQLGDGRRDGRRRWPHEVAGRTANWASVSAGKFHTCARTTGRRLFCWGDDFTGQLGDGRTSATGSVRPVEVAGHATDWASVASGDWHTCARKVDGRLFCWGRDGPGGALGNGAPVADTTRPVAVAGNQTDWGQADGAAYYTCALRATERLFCWGSGLFSRIGTDVDQPTPVEVVLLV